MWTSEWARGVVLALIASSAALAEAAVPSSARLASGEGDVLVLTAGATGWIGASINLPLGAGDRVWVPGPGRVEIQLPTGHAVRLGAATQLLVARLPSEGREAVELILEGGSARIGGSRFIPGSALRVTVPGGVVDLAAPGVARFDAFPDGTALVSVARGEARLATDRAVVRLRAGDTLRLVPGQLPTVGSPVPPDDLDDWSDHQDRAQARPASEGQLPPALAPFGADMASSGRWFTIPEVGYAWAPMVPLDWTPFREGDWWWWQRQLVWIPDEPWGWLTSHYGRWLFASGIGWVWVPPTEPVVAWDPGVVAWSEGPDFVAWVPLAPGEPASPAVTEVQVVPVTNVFVNTTILQAIVVEPRKSFHDGRRVRSTLRPAAELQAIGSRMHSHRPDTLKPVALGARPEFTGPASGPASSRMESAGSAHLVPPSSADWSRGRLPAPLPAMAGGGHGATGLGQAMSVRPSVGMGGTGGLGGAVQAHVAPAPVPAGSGLRVIVSPTGRGIGAKGGPAGVLIPGVGGETRLP